MRRRYELPKQKSTFALNITSMTDMFTIMLVFLLQTYSTSDVEIIPEKDMRLPQSTSSTNPVESIKLVVSKELIKIDKEKIADMKNADFEAKDIDPNDANFILPLFNELDKLAKDEKLKDNPAVKEGRILLQADAGLPYSVLRKVMYTASMAGFPQLKLVTLVGD
ncbi:ExbD/TolR family protein [Bdellovibrio sp. HCB337]|uniref:ExbD/TolR family protein n=1 Tax=Bdellovibrio sp. HCB337 TaxID=3394358 RepID=UPI0039A76A52